MFELQRAVFRAALFASALGVAMANPNESRAQTADVLAESDAESTSESSEEASGDFGDSGAEGGTVSAELEAPPGELEAAAPPPTYAPEIAESGIAEPAPAEELPPGVFAIGELRLRPEAEARARFEGRTRPFVPTASGAITRGDARLFVESRIRLGLDAQWRHLRVYVQAQDARTYGSVLPGAASGTSTDFHQGYFELRGEPGYVRVGRQEYALGAERFIGPLAWLAGARSFDGVRAHGDFGAFQPDLFVSWTRAQDPGPNGSEGDFLGVLALTTRLEPLVLEPYVIYRHVGPSATGPTSQRDVMHFGVRANGTVGKLVYDLEGAIQTGRRRTNRFGAAGDAEPIFAAAAIADVGVKLGGPAGLTLTLGGAYGTGASADGKVEELDNFFPTNHLFYGYADLHGLRNTIDARARVRMAPSSLPLELWVDAHLLALANPHARWSDAVGNTLAQDSTNDDRITGGEIDVEVRWTPLERFTVWSGYALFLPGPAVDSLAAPGDGRATDISHWVYLMAGVALP